MIQDVEVRRFWEKVKIGTAIECWLFTGGALGANGYGAFAYDGKRPGYAHRFSYEIHHGPIPEGHVVMHLCDKPRCVNPAHLVAGTQKANIRDSIKKGKWMTEARSSHLDTLKKCGHCGQFLGLADTNEEFCSRCRPDLFLYWVKD